LPRQTQKAFGEFLDAVRREPVLVTEENGPVCVMLSMRDVATLPCKAERRREKCG
jgi:PHD/YefM family antitoxin component YafN of YafNO toxin-antitoxin module